MEVEAVRDALLGGEDDVVGEPFRVGQEHVFLGLTLEVEEAVLVEDAQLLVLRALDEVLVVLPGDWAVVAELGQGGLQEAAVIVEVCHLGWEFLA